MGFASQQATDEDLGQRGDAVPARLSGSGPFFWIPSGTIFQEMGRECGSRARFARFCLPLLERPGEIVTPGRVRLRFGMPRPT